MKRKQKGIIRADCWREGGAPPPEGKEKKKEKKKSYYFLPL